ncbi:hypothetical protein EAH_00067760 [Eimeria acervulina]|uniref:Anticodon-binding domain-containing protein n=1 Tax=Eimeria acervulina TaxID=5801 RepID=U6GTF5_EIMAC|nr:hypothetical protein EAH_00067760 [Eimeria acervulina]CDI82857.1 hypothetical protein EAH_00067760 [Eimeria acervulina]
MFAAYDLTRHSEASKVPLVALERLSTPITENYIKANYNKQKIGVTFKREQNTVINCIESLSDEEKQNFERELQQNGSYKLSCSSESSSNCSSNSSSSSSSMKEFIITRDMVSFSSAVRTVCERRYTPSVIEPSFGLGRILYCTLEHAFASREVYNQEERVYLRIPAIIAPIKVVLLPLSNNPTLIPMLQQVQQLLQQVQQHQQIVFKTDTSGVSIGRRYARADEIGIPFAITIDFESVEDKQITLRDRDSMQQVRMPAADTPQILSKLCMQTLLWGDLIKIYPIVSVDEQD